MKCGREKNFLSNLICYPRESGWDREEQSLVNSLALITDIRTIRFSVLLFQRRKNEVLLLESVTVFSAFTGKWVGEQIHSHEPASIVLRMKNCRHQDRRYEECMFYNRIT